MPEFSSLNDNPVRFLAAFVLATLVSLLAWKLHTLTSDGAIAATLIGTIVAGAGGWWSGLLLMLFFITGSLWSKLGKDRTSTVRQQRGARRDATQVIANGGIPAILMLAGWLLDSGSLVIAAIASIGAATADTWATELGRLSRAVPRSIVSWRRVPPGTSGAVSLPGTTATACGSLLIATVAGIGIASNWLPASSGSVAVFAVVGVAGFAGSVIDSLLGATIQQVFRCNTCGIILETRKHLPGHDVVHVRGLPGVTNDIVNLASLIGAAILGLLVIRVI